VHSVVYTPQSLGKQTKYARRSNGFALPASPGTSARSSSIPAKPPAAVAEGLSTARFSYFLGTRIEEAQERPLPASEWRRWCSSAPPTHRPGQLAAHIALGITWGGLVGDRGHRKGQLRVLGSRQPLRAPHSGTQDRGATGGAGSPRTRFFLRESPFVHI
jgi:hypothetical protein